MVSRALLIRAVARHDLHQQRKRSSEATPAEPIAFDHTLDQLRAAHQHFGGFGETGEFVMAQRAGDSIVFLLRHRHHALGPRSPIPFDAKLAEPMRRALSGETGTLIGLDCRGEQVLAAHHPVGAYGLGLVAKIDLAEVRRPFVRAGLLSLTVAVLVIVAGALLFRRIGNPLVARLEAQTERLEQEVAARAAATARARESLAVKEVLLREIHHRVKNNLQVISSLLNLQSRQVDAAAAAALQDSRARLQTMARVHETLYRAEDLRRVDLADYVEAISADLFRLHRVSREQVALQVDIEGVSLDIDRAIPCGLIINELLVNSLRHGFSEGSRGGIGITLERQDDEYLLRYEDDGAGLPADFSLEDADSLGMKLVQTLARQLGGEIEVESNGGFRCQVRFERRREASDGS